MRRFLMLAMAVTVAAATFVATPSPAVAQKRVRVALPEGTVLDTAARPVVSPDGSVGFVAPAVGDTVIAFAVRTGEPLGRLSGLGPATGIALHDEGARRLLVVTLANDPDGGKPSSVVVVDASDPSTLTIVSTFVLPESVRLAPAARAEVARGQRFGVVAIVAPVAALISFDVANGQQIGALTLDGAPDRIAIVDAGASSRVAVTSAAANEVAVVSIDDAGVLLPAATFAPPADAPISTVNNVAFDSTGRRGFVASLKGRALMTFSLETGELVDRIATDGSSASISVYHTPERDLVAIANISRPGGAPAEDVAPAAAEPLGLPGAVVVEADPNGKLVERSRFYPETGEELAPSNNPEFSADGSVIYVPSRTGALYSVDALTGRARGREALDHRVQAIAAAPLAEAVAVVSAGGSEGHIDVVAPSLAPPESTPEVTKGDDRPGRPERLEDESRSRDEAERGDAPFALERLSPSIVQAGRRRDIPVTAVGTGFGPGATVLVGGENFGSVVSPNGRRASFTLPSAFLATPRVIPIQVRNPDGGVSNVLNLEVVAPYAPTIAKVSPGNIESGSGGVDLKVRGDHFRDGAVVRVSYVDPSGVAQTVDLKTYRLSFTSIVARLPHRLTVRAEEFSLTVTDRDGTTTSQPATLRVVGPSIATVAPERVVAGDVRGGETLGLRIDGENFHADAVVFVQRPARGNADPEPFRQVPASNVRRKSSTRLVVKLTPTDLAYSGTLVVRVVNPVPGERRRNGDAVTYQFTVAGPVIASTAPEVILAGSGAFILKLEGTDFRRGASVKVQRVDGTGEAQKRIFVDDPNFKDRKQVNVEMNTPELLRLVARPGELHVRVINPSIGKGDPSPPDTIQVVGPSITATDLVPSENDPTEYRLALTGTFFANGATVQLFTAAGEPVGRPVETRLKSQEELVVRLARRRVTDLRNFKVVVINPGGPYNPDGVRSNPVDVTVN